MAGIAAAGRPVYVQTDPYWSSVSALLHMDGVDASTSIADQTGGLWTASGGANLKTDIFKFGASALRLDGIDSFVSGPSTTEFAFGTGDFTIEFWFYCGASLGGSTPQRVFSAKWGAGLSKSWLIDYYLGNLRCVVDDTSHSSHVTQAGSTFTSGTWYHIAWTRSSGTSYIFIDGTLMHSEAFAHDISESSAQVLIGYKGDGSGSEYLTGRIDEFRITKGVARYTSSFTVQNSAFPSS